MKRTWKYLLWSSAAVLLAVAAFGIWFYVAIWIPNRTLARSDWWQNEYKNAPQKKVRTLCHRIISHRIGNHHDAFLALDAVGNRDSIPYLIRALKWQRPPEDGMLDCQTGHCIQCLRDLTGMDFGWRQADWDKWWRNEGSKMPPDELAKRAANKRAEITTRKLAEPYP